MLYCENEVLTKVFESAAGVEHYPYWDNTDRPKELTARQWSQRKRDWNEAIKGHVPCHNGFTLELNEPSPYYVIDDQTKLAIKPVAERAHRFAFNSIVTSLMKKAGYEPGKLDFRLFFRCEDQARDTKQAQVERLKRFYVRRLIAEPTLQELRITRA